MRALTLVMILAFFQLTALGQPSIQRSSIHKAIERSQQFLIGQQQPEGSFSDSLNNLFETWETILVTDALLYKLSPEDSIIQKAVQWLHDHESPEQLICHNQKCRQSYCLETSAVYLELLQRLPQKQDQKARIDFIAHLQEADGHWEIGNPDVTLQTGFPSVTGFVLNLLNEHDGDSISQRKAKQFLTKAQLSDGSWGATWEYYGCPGYALWQCLPAMRTGPGISAVANRAQQYILQTQAEDGSWPVHQESGNHISTELHTTFMLLALSAETDQESKLALKKGIRYLLETQAANGSWDGGLFPIPNERYKKREYLVATALTCKLLSLCEKHTGE